LGVAVALANLRDRMQYRRAKTPGGTYFFTVVTYQRRKILCEPDNIALLREIFRSVMTNHPFRIDAIVILPEHLHAHLDITRK
jgi:putative transposase